MASKIYLFSYETHYDKVLTCLDKRLWMLYDTKQINENVHLIKTEDDISILEKFLAECFGNHGTYVLVEIADQPIRLFHSTSKLIKRWMDDI
ncbi:hypothetical protein JCM21714_2211 [Gracilibacillus boraciitolerans JCM 21714]|uniref:Uncharacterized protein n=1 Tax=Gracilibacillus boraciitolerans JCM 21714 TaxID=1298598 RepID=W4VK66_9BACI|nr:hypothetical protein [Gracilibacillus boraciitolerans]GAE93159.1 hypothetical protein JCM21714_2211 [Gracilibacillus boraciitolerans JCM 21714]